MTINHPITPTHVLVHEWTMKSNSPDYELNIATQAARWGADQELDACCSIALTARCCGTKHQRSHLASQIRETRRPVSIKDKALMVVDNAVINGKLSRTEASVLLNALKFDN